MECPRCHRPLQEIDSSEGVTLDFCGGCKGVWFDRGESAAYFEMAEDLPDLAYARANARPTDARCPRCQGHLLEVMVSPREPLVLDLCGTCGGLWFDAHEVPILERIAATVGTPGSKLRQAKALLESLGYRVLGSLVQR